MQLIVMSRTALGTTQPSFGIVLISISFISIPINSFKIKFPNSLLFTRSDLILFKEIGY